MGFFSNSAKKEKHALINDLKERIQQLGEDRDRALREIEHKRYLIREHSTRVDQIQNMNTVALDRNFLTLERNINSGWDRLADMIRLNNIQADVMATESKSKAQSQIIRESRKLTLTREVDKWTSDYTYNIATERLKQENDKKKIQMEYEIAQENIKEAYREADLMVENVNRKYQEEYRRLDNALSDAWDISTGGFIGNFLSSTFGRIAITALTGGVGAIATGGSFLTGALLSGALAVSVPPLARMVGFSPEMSNFLGSIGVSGFKGIFDFGKALASNIAPALNVAFSSGGASAASAYTSFLNAPSISSSFSKMMNSFGGGTMFGKIQSGLNALSVMGKAVGKGGEQIHPSDILTAGVRNSLLPEIGAKDLLGGLKYPSQYNINGGLQFGNNAREVR